MVLFLSVVVQSSAAPVAGAPVVFTGRIESIGTATSARDIPASPDAAVFIVENVERAPLNIPITVGKRVTVILKRPISVTVGDRVTIAADGWLLGSGIGLRELSHAAGDRVRSIPFARSGSLSSLRHRFQVADDVIEGEVVLVKKPKASMASTRPPVSEHDPDCRQAIISVSESLKQSPVSINNRRLAIWFANSRDVGSFDSPKLAVGQHVQLMLGTAKDSPCTDAMATALGNTSAYTLGFGTMSLTAAELSSLRKMASSSKSFHK
jgi:hypothetical protein